MARRTAIKYKYKCLVCGTEVYSNSAIDHCDACGSDEMKKFKANDITCPNRNDNDFVKQTRYKFSMLAAKIFATALISASIIAIIRALF